MGQRKPEEVRTGQILPTMRQSRWDLGMNMFMRHIFITKGRHQIKMDGQRAQGNQQKI